MLVIDVESTGVDSEKHSILSLGALDLNNPSNQFYDECRAWDGAHIDDEALKVNGFSRAEAADSAKKSEAELVKAFNAWAKDLKDWTFAGQNPSFDRNFVIAACRRAHYDFPFAHRTIDTHTLAYMHMVKRGLMPPFDKEKHRTSLNLDAILEYVGIPAEPQPHNALTGALCHAEVIARLLYDKMLLSDFDMYPIPWTVPRIA
jgi:DNA polymerase III epsilon subunit-like protein